MNLAGQLLLLLIILFVTGVTVGVGGGRALRLGEVISSFLRFGLLTSGLKHQILIYIDDESTHDEIISE